MSEAVLILILINLAAHSLLQFVVYLMGLYLVTCHMNLPFSSTILLEVSQVLMKT
jgi:hypothetical protein